MSESEQPYYGRSIEGHAPFQPLLEHLIETSNLMSEYCSKFTCPEIGKLCGLLHDIGKYSDEFQRRVRGENIRVDHSTAGAKTIHDLADKEHSTFSKIAYSLMAYVIAGHHAGLPNMGDENSSRSDLFPRIGSCKPELYSAWHTEVQIPDLNIDSAISSLSFSSEKEVGFALFLYTHFLLSALVDADRTNAQSFPKISSSKEEKSLQYLSISDLKEKLDDHMANFSKDKCGKLNNIRQNILAYCREASEEGKGLFTLTVPTGGGKTLSSLMFALHHAEKNHLERVIYTIPFTSIIEQNAGVYKKIFGEMNVLEHHSNFVLPHSKADIDKDLEDENEKLANSITNWDAPLILTTNVQFFESLFTANPSRSRKVHNIANSVIVLDEVQALPIDLLIPCLYALSELVRNYNCSVVLCTATQPNFVENGLIPSKSQYEIIPKETYAKMAQEMKRTESLYLGNKTNEEISSLLLQEKQALCIVNTKKHASDLYSLLQNISPDSCYHLSTNMYPAHRRKVIATIKGRLFMGLPCHVVSTQLIEAGVDIDFPVVFRSLAGVDSIIQAAGRCNREGIQAVGTVYVFQPKDVYNLPKYLRQTAQLAERYTSDFLSKENSDAYFRELFYNKKADLDEHHIIDKCMDALSSSNPSYPFRDISEDFKLISDDGCAVVIPLDDECKKLLSSLDEMRLGEVQRKITPYCVNVRKYILEKFDAGGMLKFYSDSIVVLLDVKSYDENLGLIVPLPTEEREGYIY
ncbi:MAG: CRISPR-associated helicase Cas3' [Methanocorpusculum sp.]|uniref:CRISPR-associated helicase Cas3' n=1 Tax=Methanocorpusculum sp. TaxID=2058474 RepID=UPI002B206D69|nr:CRISPR-associated helicase Cas3' [Methanocorpusculum sp.]MEA5086995.1 CRISPR-associated helicase Cas3' [Methanocorpusculum sp.]